jgi:protein tyrosine phosphatase (PTP) superfamily phosphohydrolase (DUF442 family)
LHLIKRFVAVVALGAGVVLTTLACAEKSNKPKPSATTAPVAAATTAPDVATAFPAVGNPEHLPNAHRISARLVSGAQPEGDAGFKELSELGVMTIISVDGAAPDVEGAKKYGLRYVHLPITYSGVTEEEGKRLAKALDEIQGPVYLHCHHGKHRSAASVAVACVMNGQLKPAQAEDVLKTFGTGADYTGLWRDARNARPLDQNVLAAVKVDYVERAKIPVVAEAMVEIDHTLDKLKDLQKSGWRATAAHPDLDPAHEALQLREKLHEVGRTDDAVQKRPADYKLKLQSAESAAQTLEDALRAWKPLSAGNATAAPPAQIEVAFKAVSASCVSCHNAYRN